MSTILLAGDGWGAAAAFNSLKTTTDHQLYLLTTDEKWKIELQSAGYNCVDGFSEQYDLVITSGWRPIIKQDILEAQRILNIHYSLLPAYRGFHSTVWAIINNEPELGLTIHRMNRFVDDGPIIYQYKTPNNYIDSATHYMIHFNTHIEEVLLDVVNNYLSGKRPEIEQDKSKASWVGRRKPGHCLIDFDKSLSYQKAFFRALKSPYPVPYFILKDQIFEVHEVAFYESRIQSDNGRILNIDDEGVWIGCEGGYITCKKIILQSDAREYNYNFFKIGQTVRGQDNKVFQISSL